MSRILVVDDEEQVRSMLKDSLEEAGFEVETAPDGTKATGLFHENSFDLMITDMIMPNKDGLDTIMEIRRNFPEVKIIAISGGDNTPPQDYLDLANEFGADLALSKPFRLEELTGAIRGLLGEK
ncbi:response regulator transcription factor [Candidatus Hydrogenedentota bacterium]